MFELSAGQIVADKYRIDGVMGTGGMGIVVAATHVELEQRVAIKFLREVSPEALARFQREARMLVRLKGPHVARVIDVGALDDDTPYIVMEHLDGSDLATIASERKRLPVEETVDYILQACEGVAEAHALGMVHRDLKPANLFLARGPGGTITVKVLDFGVSKILDDRSGTSDETRGGDLTNAGVALGSPGYMSPEQMTSARDVDERSDIFSLGALLYRLVGGQAPYKGTSVVSILAVMATEKLPPLRSLVADVPEEFAAIVERCLANDKVMRFPSVAHLAHALEPYATRRGRLSIEQILATLNVTIGGDGLRTPSRADGPQQVTLRQSPPFPTQQHTAPMRRPPLPPPGLPPEHFTGSAPPLTPPKLTPGGLASSSHVSTVVIVLLLAGIGAVAWRFMRAQATDVVAEPRGAITAVPVTAAANDPGATASPAAAATSAVLATASAEPAAAPPDTVARPRFPGAIRARPHGAPSHAGAATATPTTASPAPNPTDVPGGRH